MAIIQIFFNLIHLSYLNNFFFWFNSLHSHCIVHSTDISLFNIVCIDTHTHKHRHTHRTACSTAEWFQCYTVSQSITPRYLVEPHPFKFRQLIISHVLLHWNLSMYLHGLFRVYDGGISENSNGKYYVQNGSEHSSCNLVVAFPRQWWVGVM